MQAMAPGKSGDLQAGHSFGAAAGGTLIEPDEPGAFFPGGNGGGPFRPGEEGGGTLTVEAGAAEAVAAAGTGTLREGAGAPPTTNGFWHDGQRNCFPAESSAICMGLAQCGQRITNGI
jgi:hypothetical protein